MPFSNFKSEIPDSSPATALYRAVWRWHFFAGLFVAPFAIFLALTGTTYLWKPQYEAWRYHDLLTAPVATNAGDYASSDAQLAAARQAVPTGWRAQSFQPAFTRSATAQVVFQPAHAHAAHAAHGGAALTVYVDPATAAVRGQLHDDDRLMQTVKKLHSSLLAGKPGEYLVELAASWALVLFATGLYLAWPRPRFVVFGFLLPRLRSRGRTFWRDLHAVPAVWCSLAAIFLLTTGLLWTNTAGAWYRQISTTLGQGTPRESSAASHRSQPNDWSPPLKSGLAETIGSLASTPPEPVAPTHDHAHHHAPAPADPTANAHHARALPLEDIITIAHAHNVPAPFVINLPSSPTGVYSVISDPTQPFRRAYLHLDQYSGRVLADVRFRDFGLLAQFFSWGIIAHEGRLFGLTNQILGTLAAAGIVLIAVSGLALWWQRRPAGQLAAPAATAALPRLLLFGLLALAALLPLLALSVIVIALLSRLIRRRANEFSS